MWAWTLFVHRHDTWGPGRGYTKGRRWKAGGERQREEEGGRGEAHFLASWVVPSSLIASSYFLRSTALYSVRGRGGEVEDVEDVEEDTEEEGGKDVKRGV